MADGGGCALISFLPAALSFLLTLVLVTDWALHRRSLVWYAGPALVALVALLQFGERYLLGLFIGGGAGGLLGYLLVRIPVDWMTLRWQRRVWIRPITGASTDGSGLIGDQGARLVRLISEDLPVRPTWVVTPAAMLEHIGQTPLEEDMATLAGQAGHPDDATLLKLAPRARQILTGEPLPWMLRRSLGLLWPAMTEAPGVRRVLVTAWPTQPLPAPEGATIWPRPWLLADDLSGLTENLLHLWAENHSLEALRLRRDAGQPLVDHRLAVALQPLPAIRWTGFATSLDPRGGGGWLIEAWRGEGLFGGSPPCFRRAQHGAKSAGVPGEEPNALVLAQAARAAQMAIHATEQPHVVVWCATEGDQVSLLGALSLEDVWAGETSAPSRASTGLEWAVRVEEMSGEVLREPRERTAPALWPGRLWRTSAPPERWEPGFERLGGLLVDDASVLGFLAAAFRARGIGVVITRGQLTAGERSAVEIRDRRGAPELIPVGDGSA